MAPEMSVLFAVVEEEGWRDAVAVVFEPKEPFAARDSAARESEVISPGFSTRGEVGEVVWVC